MDSINNGLITWLQELGMSEGSSITMARIAAILAILLIAVVVDCICKRFIIPTIRKVTAKTESVWDDHLLSNELLRDACRLLTPVIIYALIPLAFPEESELLAFILKICWIYITIVAVKLICSFISSLYNITNEHEKLKSHSLKGFYQMLKLVVICIGAILVISTVIDKDPIALLTGLGAGTAILMLVFQDTIKGLVAGIQLMANDMLRPGDWITVPKYGADGDVMEVSLTTVKVRNWDKTIVTVPPYALVNDSFQNWRGMFDMGGRRIKRSIYIDMNSVHFCSPEEMEKFKQEAWFEGFEGTGKEEVNLHIYRHYILYYLRHHPKVHQEMTLTVRQLQPGSQGLPLELYCFSADTAWIKYENLQAEVIEHAIAKLNAFGLKVFQSPSGSDFQNLSKE